MLVLPIVNRNRILNVKIRLKTAKKAKESVKYEDISSSDIIVNKQALFSSIYCDMAQNPANIMKFIRDHSFFSKTNFLVSTKEEDHSDFYDIYEIQMPPEKISEGLDNLYGSLVLDLKNEIPNREKGRYVDFEKLGIVDHITDERLEKLSYIANHVESNYNQSIIDNHLDDLIDTLKFLDLFDCVVIEKSSISVDLLKKILNALSMTNSRDAKALNNYYDIALANQKAYSRLSRLYNIVYKDSLNWIHSSKDKIKVKLSPFRKDILS